MDADPLVNFAGPGSQVSELYSIHTVCILCVWMCICAVYMCTYLVLDDIKLIYCQNI